MQFQEMLKEGREQGRKEGKEEGLKEGIEKTLTKLIKKGLITKEAAAEEFGITPGAFKEQK